MSGYIIHLNGQSSTGKSTLAQAIQARSTDPILHFTMDSFLNMIPEGQMDRFPNMLAALIDCAEVHLNHGHNLVIDTVFQPGAMTKIRTRLQAFNAVAIGVEAPLAVREEREKNRGNRKIGTTASQENLHGDTQYNLRIDTSLLTPEEAADRVLAFYQSSYPSIAPKQSGPAPA